MTVTITCTIPSPFTKVHQPLNIQAIILPKLKKQESSNFDMGLNSISVIPD